ncbi:hypothetical protein GCG21_04565 [Pseudactinotalea sp. HY160]|uniref:hypothetical protein n=1 Tax=Pseudactinotalea sp. HY160 TaxID=2654490 RepID=UPI00128C0560|nr:hypothetical protein [Pseudactinotalea sp. HY160]MPV49286.1 hypothetical protein [Pseudactinotalea sp. HY160]
MITSDSTLLRDLADLDPAAGWTGTDPATADRTRARIHAQYRADNTTEPAPGAVPRRHTGRRLVLTGAAAVLVLGLVGVLPSLVDGGLTTPPAAAIPMLDFEQPDGVPAGAELARLAADLRAAPAEPETDRYFFSHWRSVGYSMGETEVSDGHWEVDRLIRREYDYYRWGDGSDGSGGELAVRNGVPEPGSVYGPGEEWSPAGATVPGTAEELLESTTRFGGTAGRYPGNYLLSDYSSLAPRLTAEDRATYVDAFALAGDVTSYGQATDRLGRDGLAFGATRVVVDEGTEIPIEIVVLLDPDTGVVLEEDTIFPNHLPGAPAVVEEYRLLVEAGHHDSVPPCGDQACPGVKGAGAVTD